MNSLRDKWDRGLTPDEIVTEKDRVIVFDGANGNLVMTMLEYIAEHYEGDERTYIDKDGDEMFSSYRLFLVAHIASCSDNWVVLSSLVTGIAEFKTV